MDGEVHSKKDLTGLALLEMSGKGVNRALADQVVAIAVINIDLCTKARLPSERRPASSVADSRVRHMGTQAE